MTSTEDTNVKVQDSNDQGMTEDKTTLADTNMVTESAVGAGIGTKVEDNTVAENGEGGALVRAVPQYRCQMCNVDLGSLELIQQHMTTKHHGAVCKNVIFKCEICGVLFPRLDLYHEHSKLHAEGKVVPPKPDCRPKLRASEPNAGGTVGITGRLTKSGVGSAIALLQPWSSGKCLVPCRSPHVAPAQCPEYHYELSITNISTLVGPDGQPKYEWILEIPPK